MGGSSGLTLTLTSAGPGEGQGLGDRGLDLAGLLGLDSLAPA
jgi:hypothetical protein